MPKESCVIWARKRGKDAIRNEFNNGDVDHFSNLTSCSGSHTIDLLQGEIIYKLLVAWSNKFTFDLHEQAAAAWQSEGECELNKNQRHLTMVRICCTAAASRYIPHAQSINIIVWSIWTLSEPQIKSHFCRHRSDAIVKLKKKPSLFFFVRLKHSPEQHCLLLFNFSIASRESNGWKSGMGKARLSSSERGISTISLITNSCSDCPLRRLARTCCSWGEGERKCAIFQQLSWAN